MEEEKKEQPIVEDVKQQEPEKESKGMSIAALVLGIAALLLTCIWYVSITSAILAIIFGIIGRKKGGKGMGTAGLVLGIISAVFWVIFGLLLLAGVATIFSIIKNADYNALNSMNFYINTL